MSETEKSPEERGADTPVCTSSPPGMRCVTDAAGIVVYQDVRAVTVADYELCVASSECTSVVEPSVSLTDPLAAITGLSELQASSYCQAVGKSVPSDWDPVTELRCSANSSQVMELLDSTVLPLTIRAAAVVCAAYGEADEPEAPAFPSASWASVDTLYRLHYDQLLNRQQIHLSYKSPVMMERLLCSVAERFTAISRLHLLGRTHQGRPILALRISDTPEDGSHRPSVLLTGGEHGNELLAVEYAVDAFHQIFSGLHRENVRSWLRNLDIWVVPMLNPDGFEVMLHHDYESQHGRKNGRDLNGDGDFAYRQEGVDIGRNYPFRWGENSSSSGGAGYEHDYRGTRPASEPESRAIMRLAEDRRFVAAMSWHTHGTAILLPYMSRGVEESRPDVLSILAERMREAAPTQPSHRRFSVRRPRSAMDGTLEDWLFNEYGTLAFSVLGSHHNPVQATLRRRSIEGVQPVLESLLDSLVTGPSVYGRISDSEGRPVEARIEIEGFVFEEGERWHSRPDDGYFEWIVPRPGSYSLRITDEDGETTTRTVEVGTDRQRIEVTL